MPVWLSNLLLRLRTLLGGGSASAGAGAGDVDEEIRDAFIAELGEMITAANGALAELRGNPSDAKLARTLGRCFHTLKGSAPLVGAPTLADLGRAGENMMQRAAEKRIVSVRQMQAIESAIVLLPVWKDALRNGRATPPGTNQVIAQLERGTG